MRKNTMNTKNLMVSFVVIAMALFLASNVSAIISTSDVTIDGVDWDSAAVIAGETIAVKIYFTADDNVSEVVIKMELGDNVVKTSKFDVETGKSYKKVLNIKVPYDFNDKLSTELDFDIEISARNDEDSILQDELLTVQKPTFNVAFKSINVAQNIEAGETFPVDIVLRNNGYNDLDDLYIIARIAELGIEESFYFGDLVSIDSGDDEDTLSKRFTLEVLYDVAAGEYALEVEVRNDDTVLSKTKMVKIGNTLPEQVVKSGNDLMIVNPTDKVAVYTVVIESPATVSESTVVVEAGKSKKITVSPNVEEYDFNVTILDAEGNIVSTITFTGTEEVSPLASPIVVLTVILAIIFLVLLVVLIVLVTKKPEKAEEFGESYY
jgi:hypothetical protein